MLNFIISALKIIILLGFLVFIHEGGHFLIAKLFKIKVNEFAIGFGPAIFSKEKGETKYALRLIPLGGFVSLEGEEEYSEEENSFSKARTSQKIAVVLAGAVVNIIFGILLYFVVVSISLREITAGMIATKEFVFAIIQSIKNLFTLNISTIQLTGIVGISNMIVKTEGINEYLHMMTLISVSLGITNLLPLPPLDGGKVMIYLFEAIRKKPLKQETELKIQSIGFSLLVGLAIYITYKDILRIF